MESYFQYVHNLKGGSRFEKFRPEAKSAIVSHYLRELTDQNALESAIEKESDCNVLLFISEHLNLKQYYKSIILTTTSSSFIDDVDFNNIGAIINMRKINVIQHPNGLLRSVNSLLPDGGIYVGRMETYAERKDLIYKQVGKYLGGFFWLADFVLHRVIPRIPYLDYLYFFLTGGEFHAISQAEALGRLVYCGFAIVNFKHINGLSYFIAKKTGKPSDQQHPSFYPIIKLNRVGKNGEMIGVYKLRTMHPYSEYLQDYVIRLNGYNKKGKPAYDFRVTRWGKVFRRLWMDEFPQLINVLKGEMKLVGMRPLSRVRFNEFPEDLQRERIKFKPGCLPPYVALNMPDDKGNIEAERIYINDLTNHPHLTDLRYFLKAVYNILTNKIRSS